MGASKKCYLFRYPHLLSAICQNYHLNVPTSSAPGKLTLDAILCFGQSLQILEWLFALWLQFSGGSKKSHQFSVCSAFFLLWGWEQWLLSSACWNGNWKSLNTFLNQVVMYFIAGYLEPLEKFRSKEQIISCIRSVHNCLNYLDSLLACGGLWPQVSLRSTSPSSGCKCCAMIGPGWLGNLVPGWGRVHRVMSRVPTRVRRVRHPGCKIWGCLIILRISF